VLDEGRNLYYYEEAIDEVLNELLQEDGDAGEDLGYMTDAEEALYSDMIDGDDSEYDVEGGGGEENVEKEKEEREKEAEGNDVESNSDDDGLKDGVIRRRKKKKTRQKKKRKSGEIRLK
jgi:hypothetical protein